MTDRTTWRVYLSGEIHSDWRERIAAGVAAAGLPVELLAPVTDHATSDDCAAAIFGAEDRSFWHDHKGAKLNAIRTRTLIERADVVVVRFGDRYRQWNAAFDAGYAAARGTPVITLHAPDLNHALKEVDAAALAVAEAPEQVCFRPRLRHHRRARAAGPRRRRVTNPGPGRGRPAPGLA